MDEMENKENIKKEINLFCNKISNSKYTGYINVPVVIIIYLGLETYDRVNVSLKDAFTTSFSMMPSLYELQVDSTITRNKFVEMIKDIIIEVSSKGKSYHDIKTVFISMMDDSFYNCESLKLIEELKSAFEELESLDLDLTKKAFYGLFDQNKMKENYGAAFTFVEKGKKLWENIFHIEIPFVDRIITKQTQLIALNLIRDDYTMIQDSSTGYKWTSLYLHYLKISEFITCRLLREIYGRQIDDKQIDIDNWDKSVNYVLDDLFNNILKIDINDSYQYVPLKYQEPILTKTKKGFNILKRKNHDIQPIYNNVLKDEDVIKNLVSQLYDNIYIDDENYRRIIVQIISASTAIDPNPSMMGEKIINVLTKRIENVDNQLFQLNEKSYFDSNIKDVNKYLNDEYFFHQKITILNKEKEIIRNIIRNISNDTILKQITNDIVTRNRNYANILDELTLSEYGGTLESLYVHNLPTFKVNQSVEEVLMKIDINFVNNIINNNQSLTNRLELFLNHTVLNEVPYKHNLGMINKNFSNIQPIISYLLLTPSLNNNQDINELTLNYENLLKVYNDIYRDNSFFIISTRSYDSDQYIINYRRE